MILPNREERTDPATQGWLVYDSDTRDAKGNRVPYRTGRPKTSKKLRRKIMKAIKNIPIPETINA